MVSIDTLGLLETERPRSTIAHTVLKVARGKLRRRSTCMLRLSPRNAHAQKCSQLFVSSR